MKPKPTTTMPAIRLPSPSPAFLAAVSNCVRYSAAGSTPAVTEESGRWALRWVTATPERRDVPPLRSTQLDALLGLFDDPFDPKELTRDAKTRNERQQAIIRALIASGAKPRQLEFPLRRLRVVEWQRVAVTMRDTMRRARQSEIELRPWCQSGLNAEPPTPAQLMAATAVWLLQQPSAVDVLRLALERLHADEAPSVSRDDLLGSAALHAALARLTPQQWLARPAEELARLVAALPVASRKLVLNHALRTLQLHGVDGTPLLSVDGLDQTTPSGKVLTWLRGILRIYGALDGWGEWSPQDSAPPRAWRDVGPEGRRLVELLWLYDAIDEVLTVFRNEAHRPERADFWRILRPWIRDARVLRRSTSVCLLSLPGGAVIEFGEAGFAAYTYAFANPPIDAPFRRLNAARLPTNPRDYQTVDALMLENLALNGRGKLDHLVGWQASWSDKPSFSQVVGPEGLAAVRAIHKPSRWWARWR